jgi:hypothetical protein
MIDEITFANQSVWISGLEIICTGSVKITRASCGTSIVWNFLSRKIYNKGEGGMDAAPFLTWRVHNNGAMLGALIETALEEILAIGSIE